jgi:hypothetical protein
MLEMVKGNKMKGPFGPDGLRHPPPDNWITYNIRPFGCLVNRKNQKIEDFL